MAPTASIASGQGPSGCSFRSIRTASGGVTLGVPFPRELCAKEASVKRGIAPAASMLPILARWRRVILVPSHLFEQLPGQLPGRLPGQLHRFGQLHWFDPCNILSVGSDYSTLICEQIVKDHSRPYEEQLLPERPIGCGLPTAIAGNPTGLERDPARHLKRPRTGALGKSAGH